MLNKNLNKKDLINNLSISTGLSKNLSKKIVSDLILIMINNLKEGGLILKNIGSFKIINKKQRLGRNPKTKEEFLISARRAVSFTPSKNITEYLKKTL